MDRRREVPRRRALTVAVIVAVTGLSFGLRISSPPLVLPQAAFDDTLFLHEGWMLATDRWLGPYTFATLTKGPGYPLFAAAVYRLDLPLKLSEHVLHLVAAGVVSLAVARVVRARALGLMMYVALALSPASLGWASSSFSRDNFYAGVSLLLVGAVLLVVAEVPGLVRRGPIRAVPALLVGGAVVGGLAGLYALTREERIWLAPTLLLAAAVAASTWRAEAGAGLTAHRRAAIGWRRLAGASALVAVAAGATSWWAVDHVRDRNDEVYGVHLVAELAEGEGARAYAEWQRIDLGPVQRWVTVNTEQRLAAYAVSPAAAELAPHLEGFGTRWMAPGCRPPLPDGCEYPGGAFVWVLREAVWQRGHGDTAGEAQAFLGRLADQIHAACDDGRVPCTRRGLASMPPWSRIDTSQLWPSAHRLTTYLLSFDPAEPGRARLSGGTPEQWREMIRPLRGIDGTQAEWDHMARAAVDRQWPVAMLADVYRWAARLGLLPALAGLAGGIATRQGRRRCGRAALLGLVFLSGAAARIAALTVVDATAFDARLGIYVLPAYPFLIAALVTGWWILATAIGDRRRTAGGSARDAGRAEQVEPEGDGDDRLDAPAPGDARLVP